MNRLALPWLYLRSLAASRYARAHPFPGLVFDRFGRKLGYQLLRRGKTNGIGYVLNPVSMIRYFEFAFALSCLGDRVGDCLDVSSPRLFSYYVAANMPDARIRMINPHAADIAHSAGVAVAMGWKDVSTECVGIDLLAREDRQYDTIWSISVIEHISGEFDDTQAARLMFQRLRPGGKLILTVPVDRTFWDAYHSFDNYGTQPRQAGGKVFFNHWYDERALEQRIIEPLGVRAKRVEWFGEIVPGRFSEYDRRQPGEGWNLTVRDVQEFLENYRAYDSFDAMPGMGVAGILIEKP